MSGVIYYLPKIGQFFNDVIGGSNFTHKCFYILIMLELFRSDDVTVTSDNVK